MRTVRPMAILDGILTTVTHSTCSLRIGFPLLIAVSIGMSGCKDKSDDPTEECFSDNDCPEGQTCVISHDHEGDDHDHGGACENLD